MPHDQSGRIVAPMLGVQVTTRYSTGLRSLKDSMPDATRPRLGERVFQLAFGAIQWPWLLRSLHGGSRESRRTLLDRVGLPQDALPHLGSWKADAFFLHRIVDAIETLRPRRVVELGSGASSLVIAKALQDVGGGRLSSYDQHAPFVASMPGWLAEHGVSADFAHAPLVHGQPCWPGPWYDIATVPERIDLLVIDGPPWSVHPFARGAADRLFDRIPVGGLVLLDDAARPGERMVARRWRREWPGFRFELDTRGSKGTLVGVRER